jgi:xylulokinase
MPRSADLPLVMGIDLGTGGARVVVADASGQIVAMEAAPIAVDTGKRANAAAGWHEQDPEAWWTATAQAVSGAMEQLSLGAHDKTALRALSVDGTSGTIVGLDGAGRATTPALMYNDDRAQHEARELDALARAGAGAAGARITSSFSIAKMRWIEQHLPREFEATRCFAHQADFIAGRLIGVLGISDYSNALKSGFDLTTEAWPAWLDGCGALRSRLPEVVAPGARLGRVSGDIAASLGLPGDVEVVAGVTDGTAAFLASGAAQVGDDNTTLGTTLVFKRLADRHVQDARGLLYCHKLPGGRWLPGAASNVGADWIGLDFPGTEPARLDAEAAEWLPAESIAWPLRRTAERFPFRAESAVGFCEPAASEPVALFAAQLQGTAFVERLAYEVLDEATGSAGGNPESAVYATGGGSRSDLWLQLRADVTGRTYHRPECHESAFGSALLAASSCAHADIWQASRAMVRVARTFRPDPSRRDVYDEYYRRFRLMLEQRGLLPR